MGYLLGIIDLWNKILVFSEIKIAYWREENEDFLKKVSERREKWEVGRNR